MGKILTVSTVFPKKEYHIPKWFIIDANGKTLGRLAVEASKLLRGKFDSFYTPHVNQGNFVVILNANKIQVTGKKEKQKLYYRNSQRPGSLKIENFEQLRNRIPTRILEKAVWGMLPKGPLGRDYYKRLYVYANDAILYKNNKNKEQTLGSIKPNWVNIAL